MPTSNSGFEKPCEQNTSSRSGIPSDWLFRLEDKPDEKRYHIIFWQSHAIGHASYKPSLDEM